MAGFTLSIPRVENIIPILQVGDMQESMKFYVGGMGFQQAPWSSLEFACVSRDGAQLYLAHAQGQKGGGWAWMGVDDVEKFHLECKSRGVKIRQEPVNHPWACEMQVEDPDGNVIRVGSAPKPGK